MGVFKIFCFQLSISSYQKFTIKGKLITDFAIWLKTFLGSKLFKEFFKNPLQLKTSQGINSHEVPYFSQSAVYIVSPNGKCGCIGSQGSGTKFRREGRINLENLPFITRAPKGNIARWRFRL